MEREKLLLTILFLVYTRQEAVAGNDDSKNIQHADCGIYLAESTIPGAGFGMFAGNRGYKKGEALTTGDLMVPMFELDWHNEGQDYDFLWDEYTWMASTFNGMEDEEIDDSEQICVASFGMGAALNCMLPLLNVRDTDGDYYADSIGLDNAGLSSQSPGIGAFTPYYGRSMEARRYIPAGQELYVNYGEKYFLTREEYKFVPLRKNYKEADKLTKIFQILTMKLPHTNPLLEGDLWKVVKDSAVWNSRLQSALYDTSEQALQSLGNGGSARKHYNASIRSLDWLEEHGSCLDNIEVGISTIADAGRGAFARRFVRKGEAVTATPLIHVPDRNVLTMYDGKMTIDLDDTNVHLLVKDGNKPLHEQLLLNYCFGHRDSTLLLCPYGHLSTLINHSHKAPNAVIDWSRKKSLIAHPDWFNQSIKEWGSKYHAGLTIDIVALRDIEESEEILIDYGEEWEDAWQKHVNTFKSPRPDYIPAFELNRIPDLKVKTFSEYDYLSNGVTVFCRRHYVLMFDSNIEVSDQWEGFEDELDTRLAVYPCRVVERYNDDSYDVELIAKNYSTTIDIHIFPHHEVVSHILFSVPRDIFYFRDQPMHRDHHQAWSFRHDMRIPDEIFPDVWKNRVKNKLKKEETEEVKKKSESEECGDDPSCSEL